MEEDTQSPCSRVRACKLVHSSAYIAQVHQNKMRYMVRYGREVDTLCPLVKLSETQASRILAKEQYYSEKYTPEQW